MLIGCEKFRNLKGHVRYGGDLINQHGFPKGRLCLINLVTFCVGVTALVEKGRTTDVIYLDFCKAFDVVLHHVLIFTLEKSVFEEWTIQWIRYWLYVARGFLSMALSGQRLVTSGVPQGSVLESSNLYHLY